jgi:hypothetical protein
LSFRTAVGSPVLADIIARSATGDLTLLVTEYGKPFTSAGFGEDHMYMTARVGMAMIIAVLAILASEYPVRTAGDNGKAAAITVLLENITGSSSHSARIASADELWKLVLNMDPADRNAIDAETIDAISALLSGTDDYLVYTCSVSARTDWHSRSFAISSCTHESSQGNQDGF